MATTKTSSTRAAPAPVRSKQARQPANGSAGLPAEWRGLADPVRLRDRQSLLDLFAGIMRTVSGMSLYVTDARGRVMLWGEGATRTYGYPAEAAVGKLTLADLTADGAGERSWRELLDAALRDGRWVGRVTRVRSDGTRFTANAAVSPIRRPGGGLNGFLIASRDVTDEARLTQQLQADNLRLRTIVRTSPTALVCTNLTGAITEVNHAAEALTGRTARQLLGTDLGDCFTEPDRAHEVVQLTLRGQAVEGHELMLRGPEGGEVPVQCQSSLLLDPDGKPRSVNLGLIGVSRLRQVQQDLLEARAFSNRVLAAAADGLITVDATGTITEVNEQIRRLSGYARDEMVGSGFAEYFADADRAQQAVSQSLAAGALRDYPLSMTTSDGSARRVTLHTWAGEGTAGPYVCVLVRDVTEQATERELTARERSYNRGLIEASVDGLATVDFRGYIADVNARMCEMMGRPRDELIGAEFVRCFIDPGAATEVIHRTLVAGSATNHPLRHANDDVRTFSVNGSVFRDASGDVAGVFVSCRDISEQSRLQDILAAQETYNRALIDSAAEAFFAISPDGVITDVNGLASQLTDYSRRHLVGSRFSELFEDPGSAERGVAAAFEQGQILNYELTLSPPSGSQVIVSLNAGVFRDPAGSPQGLLAAARDITAQRKLEDRLRSYQQDYTRSLIDVNVDAMVALDPSGRISDANAGMEALVGRAQNEMIGTELTSYSPGPDEVTEAVNRVLRDGHIADAELTMQRPDGSTTVVSWSASTITDAEGKPLRVIAAGRDITERKRMEESHRLMLEQARELDQAKNQFVSRVSHELRSPLTGILGYLELIRVGRAGGLSDEQTRLLGIVERSGKRLLAQIEDLLLLSRIEAQTLQLTPEQVRLASLIGEVHESLLPSIREKELHSELDLDPDVTVEADPVQLERVVANLLSNAVKFTPAGGRIELVVRRDRDDAVFQVRDTGVGIPPDEQFRLFTRFFRSSISNAKETRGTGLGLFIVKEVTEAHGGTVSAESAPGTGSTFTVRLPGSPANGSRPVEPGPEGGDRNE